MYKNELSDKQKEFAQEKADLQLVIDQQKKGGEEASNAELDKVKKDLEKAQKELQEGAVEKERFQAQLEMLVQELEQKQVNFLQYQPTNRPTNQPISNTHSDLEQLMQHSDQSSS